MKNVTTLVVSLTLGLLLVAGCATTQISSGLLIGKNTRILPDGIPKRVGVSLFSGDSPINLQATEQFSVGLVSLGFDEEGMKRCKVLTFDS